MISTRPEIGNELQMCHHWGEQRKKSPFNYFLKRGQFYCQIQCGKHHREQSGGCKLSPYPRKERRKKYRSIVICSFSAHPTVGNDRSRLLSSNKIIPKLQNTEASSFHTFSELCHLSSLVWAVFRLIYFRWSLHLRVFRNNFVISFHQQESENWTL